MSDNNTKKLVEFSRYSQTSGRRLVALDPDEVAALEETQLDRGSIETQTVIILKNAAAYTVWETIAEVRKKLGR